MRKRIYGKQLKRDKNERAALFKNLMSALVLNERIQTTEAKAKAIKSEVERLVTKTRKETALAKRLLEKRLTPDAIEKMLKEVGPRFAKRPGGYTRIVKLGKRFGDDAPMVAIEWVEKAQVVIKADEPVTKKEDKKEKTKKVKEEKPKKETKQKKEKSEVKKK